MHEVLNVPINVETNILMNTFLTLDLNNKVPSANRDLMYAELEKLHWVKISPLTTLWKKVWQDNSQSEAYERSAFQDAALAAKAAKVAEYDATVIVSMNEQKTVKVPRPLAVPPVTSTFAAALRRTAGHMPRYTP